MLEDRLEGRRAHPSNNANTCACVTALPFVSSRTLLPFLLLMLPSGPGRGGDAGLIRVDREGSLHHLHDSRPAVAVPCRVELDGGFNHRIACKPRSAKPYLTILEDWIPLQPGPRCESRISWDHG